MGFLIFVIGLALILKLGNMWVSRNDKPFVKGPNHDVWLGDGPDPKLMRNPFEKEETDWENL